MIPRETLEATLPGGKTIKLRELDGKAELLSAKEAGDNQALVIVSQVMRSLISIDGEPFDQSAHTPESTRDLFSAKEWQLVLLAFAELNRPQNEEVVAFEGSFRRSAEQPSAAEGAGD
jgi:hypothetical protein